MTAKQDSKLQSCVLLFCSAASSAPFRLIASYVPPHPTRSDFFYPFVSVLLVCHTFAVRGKQGEQKTGHQKKIQPPRHRETGFQRCDIAARCTQMFVHAAAESSVLEKALQRRVLLCLFVFTSREREMGGGVSLLEAETLYHCFLMLVNVCKAIPALPLLIHTDATHLNINARSTCSDCS